jgi:hypothetical protein
MPDHRRGIAGESGDSTTEPEFRLVSGVLDIGFGADAPVTGVAPYAIPGIVAADPESSTEAPELTGYTTATATSRNGEIVVTATEQGTPLRLEVAADQLRRDPDELADDILRLCRQAAGRAGLARRAALAEFGLPEYAINLLGLPRPDEIVRAEFGAESDEYEPRSWFDDDGRLW